MMLAEATNQFVGQWVLVLFSAAEGIVAIIAIFSIFATRRDVDSLEKRITKSEEEESELRQRLEDRTSAIHTEMKKDKADIESGAEERAFRLHSRINPLVENTAAIKASQETFVTCFNNFTLTMQKMVEAINRKDGGKES